ncbi:50S ribosomal protein L7/L12 [bacterium]|jgi:large subunit ribosomal protein L7/L12|nr:50S ribosomal protein L7/L12 [bacterium]MBT5015147.1 50S ribosomal protein L7/L12 [bacterium]
MSSKIIEQISTMTVKELSELVKGIEETFGVSAAAAVAAAPAGAEGAAEAKTEFKVTLEDMGSEKIKVIKALRQVIPGLGLTDAKKLVEGTPSVLNESASKEDADKMKEVVEAAGAKVKLS